MDIKIIYGSDTGNTEDITNMIVNLLDNTEVVNVEDLEPEDWNSHKYYLFSY